MESPGAYVTERVSRCHFAWPCVLSYRPPVLWWLSPERGGMPVHDAVGINCKKGATTENQGAGVKYMGLEVCVDDCVCMLSDLLGGGSKS